MFFACAPGGEGLAQGLRKIFGEHGRGRSCESGGQGVSGEGLRRQEEQKPGTTNQKWRLNFHVRVSLAGRRPRRLEVFSIDFRF